MDSALLEIWVAVKELKLSHHHGSAYMVRNVVPPLEYVQTKLLNSNPENLKKAFSQNCPACESRGLCLISPHGYLDSRVS